MLITVAPTNASVPAGRSVAVRKPMNSPAVSGFASTVSGFSVR